MKITHYYCRDEIQYSRQYLRIPTRRRSSLIPARYGPDHQRGKCCESGPSLPEGDSSGKRLVVTSNKADDLLLGEVVVRDLRRAIATTCIHSFIHGQFGTLPKLLPKLLSTVKIARLALRGWVDEMGGNWLGFERVSRRESKATYTVLCIGR